MVHIFTGSIRDPVGKEIFDNFLDRLPGHLRSRYHSYRFEADSKRFLLGKMLLRYGLDRLGMQHLEFDRLRLSVENRPHFDWPVDFNLSHSGDQVVCAISTVCRLGIDIEEMIHQDFDQYTLCWSKDEIDAIKAKGQELFYRLWTRKEAVLKGAGTGLIDNLWSLDVIPDIIDYAGDRWHLSHIDAPQGYSMSLAVNDDRVTVCAPVSVLFGEKAIAL